MESSRRNVPGNGCVFGCLMSTGFWKTRGFYDDVPLEKQRVDATVVLLRGSCCYNTILILFWVGGVTCGGVLWFRDSILHACVATRKE